MKLRIILSTSLVLLLAATPQIVTARNKGTYRVEVSGDAQFVIDSEQYPAIVMKHDQGCGYRFSAIKNDITSQYHGAILTLDLPCNGDIGRQPLVEYGMGMARYDHITRAQLGFSWQGDAKNRGGQDLKLVTGWVEVMNESRSAARFEATISNGSTTLVLKGKYSGAEIETTSGIYERLESWAKHQGKGQR